MRTPRKISRTHKAVNGTYPFYLCVNCGLLDTEEFWRKFLHSFIKRQLNTGD